MLYDFRDYVWKDPTGREVKSWIKYLESKVYWQEKYYVCISFFVFLCLLYWLYYLLPFPLLITKRHFPFRVIPCQLIHLLEVIVFSNVVDEILIKYQIRLVYFLRALPGTTLRKKWKNRSRGFLKKKSFLLFFRTSQQRFCLKITICKLFLYVKKWQLIQV